MKKIIVMVVVAVLLAGLTVLSVSASSYFWKNDKKIVIGGDVRESIDTSEKDIWDIFFPEPFFPEPEPPVRCRYPKYPYQLERI